LRNLNDCRLYGILDLNYIKPADAERIVRAMIEGDVDLIQLRGKNHSIDKLIELATKLHEITAASDVPLIINDYGEVAAKVAVEGIHVGQDDDSVAAAREKAGRAIVVGKSTHSVEQAIAAQKEGADYLGFGPIFSTPTKPDYKPIGLIDIATVHAAIKTPIFCIGGIKLHNLGQVLGAGATRVAIVSGLLQATDISKYARGCKNLLEPET